MNQFRAIQRIFFNFFTLAQESANEDEEVIVTAQKKEERYVDVPVSVTTVSGEQLEIARVGYVQDSAAAPSVTYNRTAGMRGDGIIIEVLVHRYSTGVEPTVSAVLDSCFRKNIYLSC